jgi:ATP-dependent helicase/nuclease subunit A
MLTGTGAQTDLDLDAIRLTDAQRDALAIDRHVVVSAGAGSGKTHTLSWRFVRLLITNAASGSPDIESVVVLTFTEKAAEEMAERCRSRLSTVVRHAIAIDHPLADALAGLLDRFEGARIGTFHSFCARLLRENPIVGQDLDILEPEEASALRSGVAQTVVERLVARHDPQLGVLLDGFGSRRALLAAVEQALDAGEDLVERLEAHADDRVPLVLDAAQTARWRTWLERTGLPLLGMAAKLTAPGRSVWHARLRPLLEPLPDDPLDLHTRAIAVTAALLTSDGRLRTLTHPSVLGAKAVWRDARRYAAAKAALGALADRAADWPERHQEARLLPTRADQRLLETLVPFAQLVLAARAELRTAHRARGALDFDRLQDVAVAAVLSDEALRHRLRERHRWLMVDEFQDTDPRQWAMVRALGDAAPGEPADRVFLVGDVKQAIYGFRGGEVRLFHEAAAHLGVEPIALPENFRSAPPLITWFNRMFPAVLGAAWDPVVAGRTDDSTGTVTWLSADTVDEQAAAVTGLLAAALTTDRFGDLASSPTPPIAILLRTRTRLDQWEAALRRAGIPYQVGKGVGFWTREEVVDVVNLLHAAVTSDRLSWIGALRSPILDAPEQDVHAFASGGGLPAAAQQVLAHVPTLGAGAFPSWCRALLDRLDAWRWWDSEARANVAQLLELVDAWDQAALQTVERLMDRVQRRPRASEAPLDDSPARVVLLTVHAAKGLEFPVVVVPELDRRASGRPASLTVARVDQTWVMAATVDDVDAVVQSRATPSLLVRARQVLRTEAEEESARLLYVALTRAVDHLVLAGPDDPPAGTWGDLLRDPPDTTLRPRVTPSDARSPLPRDRPLFPSPPRPGGFVPTQVRLVASDLADGETCAARWFRRARLGQPESTTVDPDRQRAALRGTVLHSLLEDGLLDDPALARRRWRAASAHLPDADRRRGEASVLRHLARCAADPVVRAALDAPGFDELALRVPFPGGVLEGRIDRLYIDRERGGFVVLDYKTAGRAAEPHRLQLAVYAWAAATLLAANGQDVPVVGGQLVFTGHDAHVDVPFDDATLAAVPHRLAALAALTDLAHAETVARDQPERPCAACAFRCRVRAAPQGSDPPPP